MLWIWLLLAVLLVAEVAGIVVLAVRLKRKVSVLLTELGKAEREVLGGISELERGLDTRALSRATAETW